MNKSDRPKPGNRPDLDIFTRYPYTIAVHVERE